jgi:anti-sigma B factor antagonist/stage II sporulation protein AA (anti-sigma F factor antagonist)
MTVQVDEAQEGEVLVLRIEGRLDAASSPFLEKKMNTYVDEGKLKILMNFDQVEYLSSAGMRLLLSVSKKLKTKSGKMVIAGINADVMEVIRMAGFDHILSISPTEGDALKSF